MQTPRQAAVLVPVFRDTADTLRIVLIRRTERGLHPGQIAFPGGRAEAVDASWVATALRETHEEIGVAPAGIEILETLARVHTRSTDFIIHPFLGRIVRPAGWRLQADEVDAVLTPAVASLAEPGRQTTAPVQPPNWPAAQRVPCLRLDAATIVWGATLRILRPLLAPLLAGRWPV